VSVPIKERSKTTWENDVDEGDDEEQEQEQEALAKMNDSTFLFFPSFLFW